MGSDFRVVVMISLKPIEQAVRYKIGWMFPGWREEKGPTGRFARPSAGELSGSGDVETCDARRDSCASLLAARRLGLFAQDVPFLAQPTWRSGCQQKWMWM